MSGPLCFARYTETNQSMAITQFPTYDPTNYGNMPGDGPLRPAGQEQSQMPVHDKANLPSTLSPAAERQAEALEVCRDLEAGPQQVRNKAQKYLPQGEGEGARNYKARLYRSVFTNAFAQTAEGLTGFVFRRDPVLGDDVPEPIRKHCENIDNCGTHIDVFARERLQDDLTAGHSAILIDYPNTEGQVLSLASEQGLRPYWIPIDKDNIVSWRTTLENGRTMLSQLVLKEVTSVHEGLFGERAQVRYRVLYREPDQDPPVGFRLLQVTQDKRVIEVDSGYYRNQVEIPFVEIPSSGRKSFLESDPPLLDLAYLNIAHYQQWSDYAWSIHKTNVPILFGAGFPESFDENGIAKPIVVSANSALFSADSTAKLAYVSHDGAALGESQKALDDIQRNMATFGLSMLSPDKKAQDNATATAKRIDKASNDSALSVTARGLQDALERALDFHAKYLKLDDGGSIAINRDFENLTLTPVEITALSNLVAGGQLSIETLWQILQEGNVLPGDFDPENEKSQITADMAVREAITAATAPPQPKQDSVDAHYGPDGKLSRLVKTRAA